jgi:hypothetical protein
VYIGTPFLFYVLLKMNINRFFVVPVLEQFVLSVELNHALLLVEVGDLDGKTPKS